ncbi:serine/threonine-protein kinase [Paractinoplanes brasiliensis]|uniref:non-specific serine/threonine protein kinase n=1 Tax=Paractinoplanes brasiliensis TaxID=52695 RepID=A0A4R6K023_9ACTN|nr:serine/threonine-protein kinase [Actinoplanes brasiliensis]TDO40465.1 serine/threonine-protein kinase [Actinoplanes brasiliensis]
MEVRQALGGRYTLLSELGNGGMAVVWRARDEVLGRPVAVKVLAGRFAGDPQSRARIRDEARAAAALSHPNIAQVYDYGEADDLPYVVMELINGPTLQQRVSSGPLPPRTIFRVCGEVAAALAAAHEDGLVHRDIKMANIMIAPSGVKVVDFGIAAVAGPAAPEDMLVGTPAYLAPERLTGDAVEPASDVYALGVLLYRLLAHESPWTVESTTQMLQAHVYVEPEPLPDLPGVPAAVAELVHACLLKDPAERPSASEVSATLADAAEAASVADPVRDHNEPTEFRVSRPVPPVEPPRYAARPEEAVRGNMPGNLPTGPARNSAWPATVVDRPVRASRRRPNALGGLLSGVRGKYVLAGGVAVVIIAGLLAWLLGGNPEATGKQQVAAPPAAPGAVVTSVAAVPTDPARGDRPISGATGLPGPGPIIASGPAASVVPSEPPAVSPSVIEGPEPSPSTVVSPSAPVAPAGKRLDSPGGAVFAVCDQGKATLTGYEPADGFTAQPIEPGPAFTARVMFNGAQNNYRVAVTCVGPTPTRVVLPL